jgi:hypothetical protein
MKQAEIPWLQSTNLSAIEAKVGIFAILGVISQTVCFSRANPIITMYCIKL